MDYLVLSLSEAVYLYTGMAVQSLMRQSSLRYLPGTIVLLCTLGLMTHIPSRPRPWAYIVRYLLVSAVLLILFWPEAILFGRRVAVQAQASDVASYSATQDDNATVVTAEDTQQVPESLRVPVLIGPGYRYLLRAITETPLALAKVINSQAHRMFASVAPMHWLLGVEMTTEVTTSIADWVHNCYVPALTTLQANQGGRTKDELLPWDASPMRQALSQRSVVPGAQTGIQWISTPGASQAIPCDTYLDAVEFRAQSWLSSVNSPAGRPLTEVFAEELGLEPLAQARFVLYREMIRAAGPAIPAPSLGVQYGALRAAGAVGDIVSGLFGSKGNLTSTTLGTASHEFSKTLDSLSWLVGMAVFLTWWGPYILGILYLILVSLFPFVVLWALMPGNHLQPLVLYFTALLFVASSPLWWALIDQAQRLAASQAPAAGTYGVGLVTSAAWSTMVTAMGMILVPIGVGIVFFASFRAIGGLWRGSSL